MIDIEIDSTKITTKSGVAAKTGKPYSIREQDAWAYLIDPDTGHRNKHPSQIVITLENDQEPYTPGAYVFHPSSLYVAGFNRLSIGRVRLVAANAKSVKAA